MSVMVLVEMKVKPEAVNEVKGLLKQMLPDTRGYAGCQGIDIYTTWMIRAISCFISAGTRATTINAMSLGAPRPGSSIISAPS
jgi:hypothetical protein